MCRIVLALSLILSLGCDSKFNLSEKKAKKKAPEKVEPTEPPKSLRGCTTEAIQKVVRANKNKITRCYRKEVAKDPKLGGRIVVRIEIGPDGMARKVGIKENEIGNKNVGNCIIRVLKPLAYPYPGKESCTVFYPFNFSASAPE